jgi:hypothetical protein
MSDWHETRFRWTMLFWERVWAPLFLLATLLVVVGVVTWAL